MNDVTNEDPDKTAGLDEAAGAEQAAPGRIAIYLAGGSPEQLTA